MYKKLKELCKSMPYTENTTSALDHVASSIFDPDFSPPYIQSTEKVEDRYGIPADKAYCDYDNRIEGFMEYGPTERFIINKITMTPKNLLYIVGGIGVGKSSFLHFFVDEVLPKYSKAIGNDVIYVFYDFLKELSGFSSFLGENSIELKNKFLETICAKIETEVLDSNFFTIEEEVTEIWDEMIGPLKDQFSHAMISIIKSKIRDSGAVKGNCDFKSLLSKRLEIRNSIMSSCDNRIVYLAILCNYVKNKYLNNNDSRFFLFIDNVDHEPSQLQLHIKLLMKTFAKNSGIRIVVACRQTTYSQRFRDDAFADLVDHVPFKGPDHLAVIKFRLSCFIKNPGKYAGNLDKDNRERLIKSINFIKGNIIQSPFFIDTIKNLCGNSIRKTMMLCQYIIDSSVYDLIEIGAKESIKDEIPVANVLSALYRQDNEVYEYSTGSVVENIYQVQKFSEDSHFIKLRILKLLDNNPDGLSVNRLIEVLLSFNYSKELIVAALDELKDKMKRLIRSDSLRNGFVDIKSLMNLGHSCLEIGSSGKGYIHYLYSNINYIQEIMLDTQVKEDEIKESYKYRYYTINDRFMLLFYFLCYLYEKEYLEVERFIVSRSLEEYKHFFRDSYLFTGEAFRSVRDSIRSILNAFIDSARTEREKTRYREMKEKLMDLYNERLNVIEFKEKQLFELGIVRSIDFTESCAKYYY